MWHSGILKFMEYQVPQFIEVESKIVGPLTLRQFIYITGGAGLCLVLFKFLPFFLAALLSLPVAGLAGALSFYKINNKPFISIVEAAAKFYTSSRLFLWRKEQHNVSTKNTLPVPVAPHEQSPHLTRGKLHELAWSLDIKNTNGKRNHQ